MVVAIGALAADDDAQLMSVWRRKALEAFPEMRKRIEDPGDIFSIYALWFELLEVTR